MKTCLTLVAVLVACLLNESFAQSPGEIIVQKNGLGFAYYHNGREIRKQELLHMLDSYPEASAELRKGHRNILPGKVLSYAGGLLLAYPVGAHLAGGMTNWTVTGIGAGMLFLSLPFTGAVMKREQKAIHTYNGSRHYASRTTSALHIGYEPQGATLKLSF